MDENGFIKGVMRKNLQGFGRILNSFSLYRKCVRHLEFRQIDCLLIVSFDVINHHSAVPE